MSVNTPTRGRQVAVKVPSSVDEGQSFIAEIRDDDDDDGGGGDEQSPPPTHRRTGSASSIRSTGSEGSWPEKPLLMPQSSLPEINDFFKKVRQQSTIRGNRL